MLKRQSAWSSWSIEEPTEVYTKDGSKRDIVKDFRYLGSQTQSSEADIKSRKASAWKACYKLTKIWKSPLSRAFKMRLFQAVVGSVLMYGPETWTATRALVIQLDGSMLTGGIMSPMRTFMVTSLAFPRSSEGRGSSLPATATEQKTKLCPG